MKKQRSNRETKHTNSPFRTVIIGLGESAERLILPGLTLLPNIGIIALCDMDAEKLQRVSARWKIPTVYSEPIEMLEKEQPDIVVIATPPQTHFNLAMRALEHGCHVYCEKPFMPTVKEADDVIAYAQERDRLVGVNSQYYQMPIFKAAQEYLNSGRIGRLYHIEMWQHMHLMPEDESGWKAALHPKRNLFDFGTHVVDLMCHFFDAYPVAVTAQIARARLDVDSDLCVVMRLDFPGDRIGNLVLNRMSFAPKKYLEMRLDCEHAALRASYGGVAGLEFGWNSELGRPRVRFSFTKGGELRLERDGNSSLVTKQSADAISTASQAHFAKFVDAISAGEKLTSKAIQAREILRILLAGYESNSKNGELISL
ncbi:MAG: Gfo/Idh/MocA family oxidoreductase [Chloroflexi bacterium]|nr:Gfo/Idh/MocA family oxidoreductase [Chloroflexota bacterium]